jgi:hypothetical protein
MIRALHFPMLSVDFDFKGSEEGRRHSRMSLKEKEYIIKL